MPVVLRRASTTAWSIVVRVDVADERLGAQVAVGDHDGRRLLDADAASDAAVLGDLLERRGVDEHVAVPAVDLLQLGLHGLVVVRLAVREQDDQHLVLADRLADRLRQALEVVGRLGGGAGLGAALLLVGLGGGRGAGRGLPGVDAVDALLLRELPVGRIDGVLSGAGRVGDGRAGAGVGGRNVLGLGPQEEHVEAQDGDGEDEEDSDRRGDLAHDLAYRHVSREG